MVVTDHSPSTAGPQAARHRRLRPWRGAGSPRCSSASPPSGPRRSRRGFTLADVARWMATARPSRPGCGARAGSRRGTTPTSACSPPTRRSVVDPARLHHKNALTPYAGQPPDRRRPQHLAARQADRHRRGAARAAPDQRRVMTPETPTGGPGVHTASPTLRREPWPGASCTPTTSCSPSARTSSSRAVRGSPARTSATRARCTTAGRPAVAAKPGHDYAVVRLGVPGVVAGRRHRHAWFTGNYPPEASVEAAGVEGYPSPEELEQAEWFTIVRGRGHGATATTSSR